MIGLAERFIERGQVVRHLRFYSKGRCLASLEFARSARGSASCLTSRRDETEGLLRARGRGAPRAGQRLPDIQVCAGSQVTTLHSVLRGGRHVLMIPATNAPSVLSDPGLRPHWRDLHVVTSEVGEAPGLLDDGTEPVALVRPDGHVAAPGRPGSMHTVAGYLRDLFCEPAGQRRGEPSVEGAS
jgi:hypothetical protein